MGLDQDSYRVFFNWIIPTALITAIVKLATKMIAKDLTFTGAVLTTIVSVLSGVLVGQIIYFAYMDGDLNNHIQALWRALAATSLVTMIGDKVTTWIVYNFNVDKALNEILLSFINKIKKLF